MTRPIDAAAGDGASSSISSSSGMSISACISWVALAIRNSPPPIRIRSCQENGLSQTVNTMADRPSSEVSANNSAMRKTSASPEPDPPRDLAAAGIETPDQDRDEDDVVDAEHDLERGEACERGPGVEVGQEVEHACLTAGFGNSPRRQHKARCAHKAAVTHAGGRRSRIDGGDREHAPQREHRDVEGAVPAYPQRMDERKRQEGRGHERRDEGERKERRRAHQQQVERGEVPQRRKAPEVIVGGLHGAVGEVERAAHHDRRCRRPRQTTPAGRRRRRSHRPARTRRS